MKRTVLFFISSILSANVCPHKQEPIVETNQSVAIIVSPQESSSSSSPSTQQQPQPLELQPRTSTRVKVALIAGAFGIGTALVTSVATLIVHFTRCL